MIICLDTETTGLDPANGDEIIQLSIQQCGGDFFYDEYFAPLNSTCFPKASEKTGLFYDAPVPGREKLLCEFPPISEPGAHEYIQSVFDASEIIVGYNLNFDLNMLEWAGFDFSGKVFNDPMFDFRDYYVSEDCPGFEAHRGELYRKYVKPDGGYKPVRLVEAARILGFDPEFEKNAHNALFDVMATIFVWEVLCGIGWTTDLTREELAEKADFR